MRQSRPIDPQFREHALTHGVKETRARFGLGSETFRRWAITCGIYEEISSRGQGLRPLKRSLPDDFAIHAAQETNQELSDRYGACPKVITRWRVLSGNRAPFLSVKPKPIPDNFVAVAATMFRYEAAQRFGVSCYAVDQWAKKTGAKFKKPFRRKHFRLSNQQAMAPTVDASLAGRAQQHLQRLVPVYKASVVDKKRTGYVVGGKHMATQDMITLAQTKGFDPSSWERL